MGKIIGVMNMTLDSYCDHTAGIPDAAIHQHYADLLKGAGALIYGRTTYQLMESYWPEVVKNPTGEKATDDFAVAIDNAKKIVYSRTLKSVNWKNTELKNEINKEELLNLKQNTDKPIYAGSPGMIVALTQLGLIEEYQLGVQPIILGSGLTLFKNIKERIDLKLTNSKTFGSGVIILTYEKALS